MARLVVITHEFDQFEQRRGLRLRKSSNYLFFDIARELERRGHTVIIQRGLRDRATGDASLLHVDATVTPADYLDYARSFPVALNLAGADISKRRISGALLARGEPWAGAVMVKTNLNHSGTPERRKNRHALRAGKPVPFPGVPAAREYKVYDSVADVPAADFDDPDLVVERYVAETDPSGFALQYWVFAGDAERCSRYISPARILKAKDASRRIPWSIPDDLRDLRRTMGFHFGKFDFVVENGRSILIDANHTPGRAPNLEAVYLAGAPLLTDGFERMLKQLL